MSQEYSSDVPPEELPTLSPFESEKAEHSSSCSSDYEDLEYFEKFGRRVEPNFLDVEREDDLADRILPLDDGDFEAIQGYTGKMICSICSVVFKNKVRFVTHQRRHFAMDHFKCPVCFKGFNKLRQCQSHELAEHCSNASSTLCENDRQADPTLVVPSTSLYTYSGPEVVGVYKSYEIEVKHGRPERKSQARLQSKYILETQKRLKKNLELKEAKLKRADARRTLRRAKKAEGGANNNEIGKEPALRTPSPPVENRRITKARFARAHPARQRKPIFSPAESNLGPKCYFCSICSFSSEDESSVHVHRRTVHPEVPVSELLNFFFIDMSVSRSGKMRKEQGGQQRSHSQSK